MIISTEQKDGTRIESQSNPAMLEANEERLRRHARYCVKNFAEDSLKKHIESLVNSVNPYQDVRRIFKEELVAHRARSDEQKRSKEVDDDIKSRSALGAA